MIRESKTINGLAAYSEVSEMTSQDLIEQHTGLIKRIAQHLAARLPPTVEINDLIQAGAIGLLESAQRFDPSHGANFATYASIRIRGAMLDELRRYDWSPRSTRRKIREMSETIRRLENDGSSEVGEREVAEAMHMSLKEYRGLLQDSVSCSVFSWDELLDRRGDSVTTTDGDYDQTFDSVRDQETRDHLKDMIGTLPQREQLVLSLYYDQECNLKEIGEILGVSESRVCQIHGQILARLRARMTRAEQADDALL